MSGNEEGNVWRTTALSPRTHYLRIHTRVRERWEEICTKYSSKGRNRLQLQELPSPRPLIGMEPGMLRCHLQRNESRTREINAFVCCMTSSHIIRKSLSSSCAGFVCLRNDNSLKTCTAFLQTFSGTTFVERQEKLGLVDACAQHALPGLVPWYGSQARQRPSQACAL